MESVCGPPDRPGGVLTPPPSRWLELLVPLHFGTPWECGVRDGKDARDLAEISWPAFSSLFHRIFTFRNCEGNEIDIPEACFRSKISPRHFMDYRTLSSQELIQQCVTSHSSVAWREFIRRFQPLIAGVVARTAMRWTKVSPTLIDDLVQESYLKLCTDQSRRLREFQSRHEDAIYGFLKLVAYNVTMDYFKGENTCKRGRNQLTDCDPELALQTKGEIGTAEDQVLMREIDDLIHRLAANDRDKAVFLLYYRQGFSAKAIAEIPGIALTPKGVESCVHRLTVQLREHMARK